MPIYYTTFGPWCQTKKGDSMASTRKLNTKDGRIFYEIIVSRGRGKSQLTTRWYPPEGWSQKTIDRELEKVKADFERRVKAGEVVSREEEKELSRHQVDGRVVLIDCVTLWATNYFFDLDSDVDLSLQTLKQEFDAFTAQDATFIFVTNEIGSGAVSDNPIQRRFTDLQGWMNQYIASQAHQVYLMVSGIPVLIKQ